MKNKMILDLCLMSLGMFSGALWGASVKAGSSADSSGQMTSGVAQTLELKAISQARTESEKELANVTVEMNEEKTLIIHNGTKCSKINLQDTIQQVKNARGAIEIKGEACKFSVNLIKDKDLNPNLDWLQVHTELHLTLQANVSGEMNVILQKVRNIKKKDCLFIKVPGALHVTYDTRKLGYKDIALCADRIVYEGFEKGGKPHQSVRLHGGHVVLDKEINVVSSLEVNSGFVSLAPNCKLSCDDIYFYNDKSRIIPANRVSTRFEMNGSISAPNYLTINNFDVVSLEGQAVVGNDLRVLSNKLSLNGTCSIGSNFIFLGEELQNLGQVDIKNNLNVNCHSFINEGQMIIGNYFGIYARSIINEGEKAELTVPVSDISLNSEHYHVDLWRNKSHWTCGRCVVNLSSLDGKISNVIINPSTLFHN